jgi:transposase
VRHATAGNAHWHLLRGSTSDRHRLEPLVHDRNTAQKPAWRAEIVLLSAARIGTVEVMRRTGMSKTCVWRWQERFAEEGVDGLLRDKTRPSRIPPLAPTVAERVVALTLTDPPVEATHWTAAMMAHQVAISVSSVQRIWRAHGLQPHRVRQLFVEKLRDVVGLYVDPPAHAIVLSFDQKSQIQALDPGGPHAAGCMGWLHPAWSAAEEGAARGHDPRLQAQRHDRPVRRPERPRRHRLDPTH